MNGEFFEDSYKHSVLTRYRKGLYIYQVIDQSIFFLCLTKEAIIIHKQQITGSPSKTTIALSFENVPIDFHWIFRIFIFIVERSYNLS